MEWIKLYYFSGRDFESRSTIAYSVSQMATAPEQSHQMQTAVNCDTCENIARHLCKSCLTVYAMDVEISIPKVKALLTMWSFC